MTPESEADLHRRYFLAIVGDGITPEYALELTKAYIHACAMRDAAMELPPTEPPVQRSKPQIYR